MITSRFLKQKIDLDDKNIKNIFQQKNIDNTGYEHLKNQNETNIYSYITKLKEIEEEEVKKNYLLHGCSIFS